MPVNWTPMVQGVWNAAFAPDPSQFSNPAYGAQYYQNTDSTMPNYHKDIPTGWYSAEGTKLDPDLSSQLGKMTPAQQQTFTSMPYHRPGFWGRTTEMGQQMANANEQALPYYGTQSSAQAAQQRGLIGTALAQAQGQLGGAKMVQDNPDLWSTMAARGDLSGPGFEAMKQAQSNVAGGVVPARTNTLLNQLAADSAVAKGVAADNPEAANPWRSNYILNKYKYENPAQLAAQVAQLQTIIAQNPESALGPISQNVDYANRVVNHANLLRAAAEGQYPGIFQPGVFRMGAINQNTGAISPTGLPNPALNIQGTMISSLGGLGLGGYGMQGTTPTTVSSGNAYQKLAPQISPLSVPPINGGGIPTTSVPVGNIPLSGDYSYNPTTGHLYRGDTNVDELHSNARQARIKADKAQLDAELKTLQAQHETPWNQFINAPYGPWPTAKAIGRGIYNAPSGLIDYLSE